MKNSPYVGPLPFTRDEQRQFKGREYEKDDLVSLIQARAFTLIYAPSGAGKTSLLRAAVVPALEKINCSVLGIGRIGGETIEAATATPTDNVFADNLLRSFEESHRYSGPPFERLSELFAAPALVKGGTRESAPKLRVIVIDQFEELFTKHTDRWAHRRPFMKFLGDMIHKVPGVRIVVAMREEYLASLEPLMSELPVGIDTRYRLSLLGVDAARRAIREPAAEHGVPFRPDVIEALLSALRRTEETNESVSASDSSSPTLNEDEFIEPMHLQVICKTIWDALPEDATEITSDQVQKVGNVEKALEQYYDQTVSSLVADASLSAISELEIRSWIEDHLILQDDSRGLINSNTLSPVARRLLHQLDRHHLVRPEIRGWNRWYELAHDRFVRPIRRSNARALGQSVGIGALAKLAAREYAKSRRPEHLLADAQLDEAEKWASALNVGVPADVAVLLKDSRLRADRIEKQAKEEALAKQKEISRVLDEALKEKEGALAKQREISSALDHSLKEQRVVAGQLQTAKTQLEARRRRLYASIAVLVAVGIALCWSTWSLSQARRKEARSAQAERAHAASLLAQREETLFDALEFGILAVVPAVDSGAEPLEEATAMLRAVVETLSPHTYSAIQDGNAISVQTDALGKRAALYSSGGAIVFDAVSGREIFSARDDDLDLTSLAFLGDGSFLSLRWSAPYMDVKHGSEVAGFRYQVIDTRTGGEVQWISRVPIREVGGCCQVSMDGQVALLPDWHSPESGWVTVHAATGDRLSQPFRPASGVLDSRGVGYKLIGSKVVAIAGQCGWAADLHSITGKYLGKHLAVPEHHRAMPREKSCAQLAPGLFHFSPDARFAAFARRALDKKNGEPVTDRLNSDLYDQVFVWDLSVPSAHYSPRRIDVEDFVVEIGFIGNEGDLFAVERKSREAGVGALRIVRFNTEAGVVATRREVLDEIAEEKERVHYQFEPVGSPGVLTIVRETSVDKRVTVYSSEGEPQAYRIPSGSTYGGISPEKDFFTLLHRRRVVFWRPHGEAIDLTTPTVLVREACRLVRNQQRYKHAEDYCDQT